MSGSFSRRVASRIHIAVCGSTGTDRQVLRHALDEPQRQREGAHRARADVRVGDVVLERVDELVAEHVVTGLDRPRERQHDAALVGLGHAAGAFAELAFDGVGLPEVRPARVEDERLAAAQLVIEQLERRVYQRSAIREAICAASSSSG